MKTKQYKQNDISFKGSFTLEAACLMPVIVFLIWNIIYLSFFLYNQSVGLQGSYCTALRTERLCGTNEEKYDAAEEKYEQAVIKKTAAASVRQEIEITRKGVQVATILCMRAPAGNMFHSLWEGQQKQRVATWEPKAFIRTCRKTEKIGELIQTGNSLE